MPNRIEGEWCKLKLDILELFYLFYFTKKGRASTIAAFFLELPAIAIDIIFTSIEFDQKVILHFISTRKNMSEATVLATSETPEPAQEGGTSTGRSAMQTKTPGTKTSTKPGRLGLRQLHRFNRRGLELTELRKEGEFCLESLQLFFLAKMDLWKFRAGHAFFEFFFLGGGDTHTHTCFLPLKKEGHVNFQLISGVGGAKTCGSDI